MFRCEDPEGLRERNAVLEDRIDRALDELEDSIPTAEVRRAKRVLRGER